MCACGVNQVPSPVRQFNTWIGQYGLGFDKEYSFSIYFGFHSMAYNSQTTRRSISIKQRIQQYKLRFDLFMGLRFYAVLYIIFHLCDGGPHYGERKPF